MKKQTINKGITLIALAITIVVLLILTGVTVSTIGNGQIFSRASASKQQTEISEEKNILKASVLYSQNMDSVGEVTLENLRQGLDKNIDEKYQGLEESVDSQYGKIYELTFKKTGNMYIILSDGTIYSQEEFYNKNDDNLNITPGSISNFVVGSRKEIQISGGLLNNPNIKISWKSTDEDVVEIQENESDKTKVIAIAKTNGNSIIEAKVEVKNSSGSLEKTKTAICSILVRERNIIVSSINLNADDVTIDLSSDNITRQITATTDENETISNDDISWKSLQPEIASVDKNGLVTGVSNGTAIISARIDNGRYATIPVRVRTTPTAVKLDNNNPIIDLSKTNELKLNATIEPSTANYQTGLTWTSSDTSVATVDKDGNVIGIKNGKTIIRVETENGKFIEVNLTVQTSPTGIELDRKNIILDLSGTKKITLNATISPSTVNVENEITWTIENPVVAKVENGTVTGLSNGNTKLIARTENGMETTCDVVVQTSITSIALDKETYLLDLVALKAPNTGKLNAIIEPKTRTEQIIWTSSNETVVQVDQNGNITAKNNGNATITVKSSSGRCYANCNVTVTTSITVDKTSAQYTLPAAYSYEVVTGTTETCAEERHCTSWAEECSENILHELKCWATSNCDNWDVKMNCYESDVTETRWQNGETTVSFTLNQEIATSNLKITWTGSNGVTVGEISKNGKTYTVKLENSNTSNASGTLGLTYINGGVSRTIYAWKIQ